MKRFYLIQSTSNGKHSTRFSREVVVLKHPWINDTNYTAKKLKVYEQPKS